MYKNSSRLRGTFLSSYPEASGKRATTLEFTTEPAIIFIHCYRLLFFQSKQFPLYLLLIRMSSGFDNLIISTNAFSLSD